MVPHTFVARDEGEDKHNVTTIGRWGLTGSGSMLSVLGWLYSFPCFRACRPVSRRVGIELHTLTVSPVPYTQTLPRNHAMWIRQRFFPGSPPTSQRTVVRTRQVLMMYIKLSGFIFFWLKSIPNFERCDTINAIKPYFCIFDRD